MSILDGHRQEPNESQNYETEEGGITAERYGKSIQLFSTERKGPHVYRAASEEVAKQLMHNLCEDNAGELLEKAERI